MPVKTKFELKPGAATREAYGQALAELGKKNPNIVVLDADLAKSTFSAKSQDQFPAPFSPSAIPKPNRTAIAAVLRLGAKFLSRPPFAVFHSDKANVHLPMPTAYPPA